MKPDKFKELKLDVENQLRTTIKIELETIKDVSMMIHLMHSIKNIELIYQTIAHIELIYQTIAPYLLTGKIIYPEQNVIQSNRQNTV